MEYLNLSLFVIEQQYLVFNSFTLRAVFCSQKWERLILQIKNKTKQSQTSPISSKLFVISLSKIWTEYGAQRLHNMRIFLVFWAIVTHFLWVASFFNRIRVVLSVQITHIPIPCQEFILSAAVSHLKSSPSLLASFSLQLPKIGFCFSQVLTAYYLVEWQFEREGNLNLHSFPPSLPSRVFTVPQVS